MGEEASQNVLSTSAEESVRVVPAKSKTSTASFLVFSADAAADAVSSASHSNVPSGSLFVSVLA